MHRTSRHSTPGPSARLPFDEQDLLASAERLRRMARDGSGSGLLRGRNLALLSASPDGEEQALFRRAATELGAQVAGIRSELSNRSTESEVQDAARLLSRLYDAVECQGMPGRLVRRLGHQAGIPFFEGLACRAHPTAALTVLLKEDAQLDDRRRLILQAALLNAIT